jgi:hypothetical protein
MDPGRPVHVDWRGRTVGVIGDIREREKVEDGVFWIPDWEPIVLRDKSTNEVCFIAIER